MWTHFWDMNSGGSPKEDWSHIFIELPEDKARAVFFNRFKHNPDRITCTCCGPDYAVETCETLEEATEFHRQKGFESDQYLSVEEYKNTEDVLFIPKDEITSKETIADIPVQGWVWHD